MADLSAALRESVLAAYRDECVLDIRGAGSKTFYGRSATGVPLDVSGHSGIIDYQPGELVLTARAGTPLDTLEQAVAEAGQILPFDPPHFGGSENPCGTLGGIVACGLSGPRRPYAGAVRDLVLGTRIINGKGEDLRFGGKVIKNVAGYDLSRLMVGAMGTLGVLLDISIKLLPAPRSEVTLSFECDAPQALDHMNGWAGQAVPLSAAAWVDGVLRIRLSGFESAVSTAVTKLGGERQDGDNRWWHDLRDHTLPFFSGNAPLWRLSVGGSRPQPEIEGSYLLDWGGSQRWYRGPAGADVLRPAAVAMGGHATAFRGGNRNDDVFHLPAPATLVLHRKLKAAMDPLGILNPGRLYAGL
ncbi:MAG: glycolate oxidase subunit GlcE [Gammaproteobacteria bacterium]